MTPIAQARRVYETEPCQRTFDEDLALHYAHGFVLSTPFLFVMARPVSRLGLERHIVDPIYRFEERHWDCWHVHCAAGDLTKIWDYYPISLPFASWQVKNELRIYRMGLVRASVKAYHTSLLAS